VTSLARDNQYSRNSNEDYSSDDRYDNVEDGPSAKDNISLESILAEYKGTAYIDGDKRTPSSVLQEKTDKIVHEVVSKKTGQAQNTQIAQPIAETPVKISDNTEKTITLPNINEILKEKNLTYRTEKENTAPKKTDDAKTAESNIIPFSKYKNNIGDSQSDIEKEVNQAIETQTQLETDSKRSIKKVFSIFSRNNSKAAEDDFVDDELLDANDEISEVPIREEEVFEEPDYRDATKRFADRCNAYSMRSFISFVITVIMAVLTFVFESGAVLPFGNFSIEQNKILFTGILLIFLCIIMMLSVDKLIIGVTDIFKRGPGVESLNLFSCLATIASAMYSIYTKDTVTGMPYCIISAFSLTFMLWADKIYFRALTETMKTAQAASSPSGVIAEMCDELDSTIIKKAAGRTSGFYNNLIQTDISETAFKYAAPVLIVASCVLAFYASVGHGQAHYFLHHFAAVMAAASPFSAVLAFAVPFSAVTRRARQSGTAIAGWGGADDLYHTDGVSITDEDLFPMGTVSIAGIKIFDDVSPEKAIRYTASLIISSGSGLAKLFSEQLSKQAMNLVRVEDFSCYEGGISGLIKGERAITGSAAFMNLMGIRVPSSLNMKNAIYTAINKKLIAIFAINYVPTKSVQNALVAVLRYRVKLIFAVRDFNITPVMLEQKFKVPIKDVEYLPIQNTYEISDDNKQEAKRVSAVLIREGLGPYVESITGARRLRTTSLLATIFTILSACAGMLIMFTICWAGSFVSASAGNLLLYMLSMLFVTLIICGFAKYRQ
jgi:hypothetical protein